MRNKNTMLEAVPDLSTVSSRGQIVIPYELREKLHIEQGSVFAILSFDDMLVMKKVDGHLSKEEMETLTDIKDAWEDIERGEFKVSSKKEFLKEIKKW